MTIPVPPLPCYLILFLLTMLVFCCLPCLNAHAEESAASTPARLRISEEGAVLLNGKPFRGVGINYFDAFRRRILDSTDTSYREGFEELAAYGIPFIRFACGGFWANEWKLYLEDRDAWFAALDDVVESASKNGIGLIPSVFWWYAGVPDLVGEPVDQLGNPESKTIAFIRQYTEDLVSRYKDHPAFWAWEFGNEYNLAVDLPNAMDHLPFISPERGTPEKRTERDTLTTAQMLEAMRAFGETVREIDPHRPVTSGHAILRPSQLHQRTDGSWDRDSMEQHKEEWLHHHPDPYNLISTHLYPEARQGYFDLDDCPYEKHLELTLEAAASVGKAVFVGEFGAGTDEKNKDLEKVRTEFFAQMDAIEKSGVPLAALWVYDFDWQDKTYNITSSNHRSYQLEALRDLNRRMRKQDN